MLKKLLKYDWKRINKFLLIFYSLTLFFAIITRLFYEMNQTVIVQILGRISLGCMIAMIANCIINTFMRNWVLLKNNFYGDESYLTHTLPVIKRNLYESKFIISVFSVFLTAIVSIVSLLIVFYSKDFLLMLKGFNIGDFNVYKWVFWICFLVFIEFISILQIGFLGIILGHRKNNSKVVYSIIYGLVIYFVVQTISLLVILFIGLFNHDMFSIFTSSDTSLSLFKSLFVISTVYYIFIILIENILCVKWFSKGVNVA